MCQQNNPKDYILATGIGHTIEDFLNSASELLQVDWRECVHNNSLISRTPKATLIGDPGLAKTELKWSQSVNLIELINIMIKNEMSGTMD